MRKQAIQGFTMIELLVVISIIGILASIGLVSFSGAQKQARDSQRKSDLKQYQSALEIFANKNNGLFPPRTATARASTTLCGDLSISTCSEDPRYEEDNSFVYNYQSDGTAAPAIDATQYVLWGKLENTSDYWVNCSDGRVGTKSQSGFSVSGGNCPL